MQYNLYRKKITEILDLIKNINKFIKFNKNININSIENINSEENIKLLIQNTKKNAVDDILENFRKNPKLNCQIIILSLKKYDKDINNLKNLDIGHANSIIIYRFIKDNVEKFLCIRTEPHRHSRIYCRNSLRKEIWQGLHRGKVQR
jgi:predicted patatin/cPLA2 family phospholipase